MDGVDEAGGEYDTSGADVIGEVGDGVDEGS